MADGRFDNVYVNNNVGIGTEEPTTRLHIVSAAGISNKVYLENIGGSLLKIATESHSAAIGTENAFPLSLQTNGVSRLSIDATGNVAITKSLSIQDTLTINGSVGIGTATPTQKLEVVGTVKASAFEGNGANLTGIVKKAGDTITGLMTIQNSLTVTGNVGIGTSQPRTPLHVLGRISTGADFTSSAGAITFFPPDGFAWFHIDNGPAGGRPIGRLRISHGGNPGDNEIINILQNSNVGIGTANPGFKLDVAGRIRLRQRPNESAGIWFYQTTPARDQAFVGMVNDTQVGFYGNTGVGWGFFMDTSNGNAFIPSGRLSFGSQVRQMINLWREEYGIGVQAGTQYFRTGTNFCWFRGGVHNDNRDNPGGGVRLMALNESGDLILSARTNPQGLASGSACRALVDGANRLIINFGNDYSQGVEITNGRFVSSRQLKENIADLSTEEAAVALNDLNPVKFSYKTDSQNNLHLGFIAEDVPELLASPDRKSVGPLDVVAVLTKVVQQQQKTILELMEKVKVLEAHLSS